jgi:L,D-transpeptidase catalytic domain
MSPVLAHRYKSLPWAQPCGKQQAQLAPRLAAATGKFFQNRDAAPRYFFEQCRNVESGVRDEHRRILDRLRHGRRGARDKVVAKTALAAAQEARQLVIPQIAALAQSTAHDARRINLAGRNREEDRFLEPASDGLLVGGKSKVRSIAVSGTEVFIRLRCLGQEAGQAGRCGPAGRHSRLDNSPGILEVFANAHMEQAAWRVHGAGAAAGRPIMAIISLRRQQITIYDAQGWILRAPVSSGQSGRETPAGIFSVIQKQAEHYSNLYDDASMLHMQRLTWSGIALHGGVVPDTRRRTAVSGCPMSLPNACLV